jgi:hypothetical protein
MQHMQQQFTKSGTRITARLCPGATLLFRPIGLFGKNIILYGITQGINIIQPPNNRFNKKKRKK